MVRSGLPALCGLFSVPINCFDRSIRHDGINNRKAHASLELYHYWISIVGELGCFSVTAEMIRSNIFRLPGLVRGAIGVVIHIFGYGFYEEALSYRIVRLPPNIRGAKIWQRSS